jgi:CBS domain-containing protein
MAKLPPQLQQAAEQVHQNGKAKMVRVKELLSWFNAQRRGILVVREIRTALRRAKLVTVPDFEVAYIDQRIKLKAVAIPDIKKPSAAKEIVVEERSPIAESTSAVVGGSVPDPAPRIGMLEAANTKPVSVKLDTDLREAVTIMALRGFSQLPVMPGERTVDGLISWRSIGNARMQNKTACERVRDCLESVEIVSFDMHLFDAVRIIAEKEVVLVRDSENKISGVVTTSDISVKFGALSEPFLLLSEIENHIRRLIDGKFSLDELKAARNPTDADRKIDNVANLTFGEYIRLLDTPTNWARLNFQLDRVECVKRLREVGRIRNDVMHFHPDGISPEDLDLLRETRRFLQGL